MAKHRLADGVQLEPPEAWGLTIAGRRFDFRKDEETEVPDELAKAAGLDEHPSLTSEKPKKAAKAGDD